MQQPKKVESRFGILAPLRPFLCGLSIWLTGVLILWLMELVFVAAATPQNRDYRLLQDGMSVYEALRLAFPAGKVMTALLLYCAAGLVLGMLSTVLIRIFLNSGASLRAAALNVAAFTSFWFLFIAGIWLASTPAPPVLSWRGMLLWAGLLVCTFLAGCFSHAQVASQGRDMCLPVLAANTLALGSFLFGGICLSKWFPGGIARPRALLSIAVLMLAAAAVYFGTRMILSHIRMYRSEQFCNGTKSQAIFLVVLSLACCGILFLKADLFSRRGDLSGKPNVVLIVLDTTRADHLGCYGYGRETTPQIDQIAREGEIYLNVRSTSSWTLPSHVSLFTGLHTCEHGSGHQAPRLPEKIETMAALLGREGYRTLGYSNNPYVSLFTGLDRGFEEFREGWRQHQEIYLYEAMSRAYQRFSRRNDPDWIVRDDGAAKTTRVVSDWIGKNSGTPFFVFINYMEPHMPYEPPPPYDSLFLSESLGAEERRVLRELGKDLQGVMLPRDRSAREVEVINALYDGEIRYLDGKIGELYRAMKDRGLLDNTLLILTSDHGENLGDHRLVGHTYGLFETLLRVPLIVRWPTHFKAGSVIDGGVQLPDIFYTVMEAAGVQHKGDALGLGKSLNRRRVDNDYLQLMLAQHDVPTNVVRAAAGFGIDARDIDKEQRTIIMGMHKYIETSTGEQELYDLAADPSERNNLIRESAELASDLRSRLIQLSGGTKPAAARQKRSPDAETEERLRSLGYVR